MANGRRLLGFLAMMLVALVVAHDLVFLFAYGAAYDEALAHSGHDATWSTAVAVVLAAGFGLLGLAIWRLYRLGLIARTDAPTEGRLDPGPGDFGGRLAGLWLRLAGATTLLYVVQENIEHQRVGEALPGLGVLGSAEYPHAALIIAGVAFAVALVGALLGWRRDLLIARIAAALRMVRRRPAPAFRRAIADRDRRPESIIGCGLALRAPPVLAAP
jgi:hypothetical protein